LAVTALKAAMRRWGIEELVVTSNGRLRVQPVVLKDSQQVRLEREQRDARWDAISHELVVPVPSPWPQDLVAWVAQTLGSILA
jgi:hypothetical protein